MTGSQGFGCRRAVTVVVALALTVAGCDVFGGGGSDTQSAGEEADGGEDRGDAADEPDDAAEGDDAGEATQAADDDAAADDASLRQRHRDDLEAQASVEVAEGVFAEVYEVGAREDATVLWWGVRNDSDEEYSFYDDAIGDPGRAATSAIGIVDLATAQVYRPLEDADGECLCPDFSGSAKIAPGDRKLFSGVYPPLDPVPDEVAVDLDEFGTPDGIPVVTE